MVLKVRGQGSLEFLMTYGWALLIIMAALLLMWQWGLFSLGERVEPSSFGFWGLVVQQGNEFIMHESGQLQVSVLNTVGANLTLLYYNATILGHTEEWTCTPPCDLVIEPGENEVLLLSSASWSGNAGERFQGNMVIHYNDSRTGGNIYQSSGRLWGSMEI
jgi:hypothetical protein